MKIGVVLPLAEYPQQQPSYSEIRELALQAEEANFDSIWLFDHLLFRSEGQPTRGVWECWTILAALAEATKRIQLGTLVLCTAFRNPAVLAKMAVTLDAMSDGRLILGLGSGWHKPEFDAFGIPFDHRVDRFEEALQIIAPLLHTGKVDFQGKYYWAHEGELKPGPIRPGGPPILIGAFQPRMLRLTARYADMWNTCWLGPAKDLVPRQEALRAACAQEGRDPATLAVTVGVNVFFDIPDTVLPDWVNPENTVMGSIEQVATVLHDYEALGVTDVICNPIPNNKQALEYLSKALQMCRSMGEKK
jgi:probable F420-dependent oxidoreductase